MYETLFAPRKYLLHIDLGHLMTDYGEGVQLEYTQLSSNIV